MQKLSKLGGVAPKYSSMESVDSACGEVDQDIGISEFGKLALTLFGSHVACMVKRASDLRWNGDGQHTFMMMMMMMMMTVY